MKIAFIMYKLDISDPMGIMYLSASLKKQGHFTKLFFANEIKEIKDFAPDILAYSITTGNHKELIESNKNIKKFVNARSIFGGPHATFYPEIISEEGIDAVCIGEGELSFIDLLKDLNRTEVRGLWIKKQGKIYKNPIRELIGNLDTLPFPDREIVYEKDAFFKDLKIKRFITARGCPFNCSYCFNHKYNKIYSGKGKIIRHRSVDNVLKEIIEVKRNSPLEVVKFIDDTFNIDKGWLKEFSEKYSKKINLPFICNIRADLVDKEVVNLLKKANCHAIYMGIESGNEKIRREILRRNITDKQIVSVCRLLKNQGIKIVSQNMIGLPTETIDNIYETIILNNKCKIDFAGFSIFQPYPDTDLANFAIKNRLFNGNFDLIPNNYLSYTVLNYSNSEKRKINNLVKFSTLLSRYSFLINMSRFFITIPENKLYDLVYKIFYSLGLLRIYGGMFGSGLESLKYMNKLNNYLSNKEKK